jgi:hypothetical protein
VKPQLPRPAPAYDARDQAETRSAIERAFEQAVPLSSLNMLRECFVADMPDPVVNRRLMIWVADEAGGAQPAVSDGTNWRRFSDRAIVS